MISTASLVLGIAAAALVLSSALLSGFALRQRRYRGARFWLAALWLTSGGVALAALSPGPAAQLLASLLLVQWPIVTLVGMRRFQARQPIVGRERTDWAVLAAVALIAGAGHFGATDGASALLLPALAAVLAHLYAACLLFTGPSGREAVPMQVLALTMVLVALGPVMFGLPEGEATAPLAARALAAALGSIVLAFAAFALVSERTERRLRESQRRLQVLANLDTLTQVPNRRHFHELAAQALRTDPPGSASVLMFDIDHFKQINDRCGHAAGDRALRLVSDSLQRELRVQDVAGRLGGDEFVLLLRHAGTDDAMRVAARIAALVQTESPNQHLPALGLSFGMVKVRPGERLDEALHRADQALYEAKRQGRSCAVLARGGADRPEFSESQRLGLTPTVQ